ncbi:Alpha/beta hydrolase fold protein [Crenothrix polyspora]|uniref:Alpha/beta hydrolase fold protein n=1 Tax=Crenothrix polyspora TaxID=360316 RepID=A0A1R4HBM4_9GAMM|nr:alpha/beta fold hydrolase [Crenothrix polyspora]SJM93664.1 Alpha/beta hydrolase fold protein [Crenothrix polyspora]
MVAIDLAFEEFGAADLPPLLILHGFFASSRNWRSVAQQLAGSFHVYVLDMRNHGASPHDPVMDYAVMAEDVLRFMDTWQIVAASILGHSMGGKIAMWFALNYPERVTSLIVVDIVPVSYPHRFDNIMAGLKALPLASISNRKQAEVLLAESIPELGYRQFLLQNLALTDGHYGWRIDLDIFAQTAPNIAAFPDAGHLAPFTGQTLFIAGADSDFISEKEFNCLFPQAILTRIEHANHWVHVQQPAVFIAAVMDFLQRR